jgi:hypothetical protein
MEYRMAKKTTFNSVMNNDPVEVKPSTIGLGVALGLVGLWAAYDTGRNRGQAQSREQMGAVHRSMGGRGPQAGAGVAGWLGGRGAYSPYQYEDPSSVHTGWQNMP